MPFWSTITHSTVQGRMLSGDPAKFVFALVNNVYGNKTYFM